MTTYTAGLNVEKDFQEHNRLVFVDIETTGLEEDKDFILEVGLKVTDANLNVLGEWSSLVLNEGQSWRAKLAGNTFVWEMHMKSGLIKELDDLQNKVYRPGSFEPNVVAWAAYQWLENEMGLIPGIQPMVGSSVHFDRDFLFVHMITLHSFFSYREADVSGLKEWCKRFNPDVAEDVTKRFKKEDSKHRVLPDIDNTIAELKFYVDNFLFVPGNALDASLSGCCEDQLVIPGMESIKP